MPEPRARHYEFGPFSLLIMGRVWGLDLLPFGIYGIGWRVRFRLIPAPFEDVLPTVWLVALGLLAWWLAR